MYVLDREKNSKTGRTVTTYPWAKNLKNVGGSKRLWLTPWEERHFWSEVGVGC